MSNDHAKSDNCRLFRRVVAVVSCYFCLSSVAVAAELWNSVPAILKSAAVWRVGNPIPEALRRYRESEGHLPNPADSANLIQDVTNVALLVALATDEGADTECREYAFTQGMYTSGPTKFAGALSRVLQVKPEPMSPWLLEVGRRISKPHVVVDGMFIDDGDLSADEKSKVMDRFERELKNGARWTNVLRKYADQFSNKKTGRTKVGNLGRFVVFSDPWLGSGRFKRIPPNVSAWEGDIPPLRLYRLAYLDASHVPRLLESNKGDVVRLHSDSDGRQILYQVQEVFSGLH
jgi:hypothetical protein